MKLSFASGLVSFLCIAAGLSAATLTHRYEFGGNLNDSVGSLKPTTPIADAVVGTVTYGASRPPKATGPIASVQLGKEVGKISGFTVPADAFSDAGSVSLWFQADQANAGEGADYIFNLGGTYNKDLRLSISDNKSSLGANVANTNHHLGMVTAGTWYHVVITWDRVARTADLYLNGAKVRTATWSDPELFSLVPMRVGNWAFSRRYVENQFRGSIYDLQIYSGQLGAADVSRLHASPGTVTGSRARN